MSNATKENLKGSVRGYRSRRKLFYTSFFLSSVVAIFLFIFIVIVGNGNDNGNGNGESEINNAEVNIRRTDERKSANEIIGTLSAHPLRSIDYGVKKTPVVMIRSTLSKSLHQRFLQELLYSCTEKELNLNTEVDNRVKVPYYIYEGYFHSLRTNDKIFSRNPNPMIGKDFMKPPAERFTRAFFDTFRYVNRNIFNKLKDDLYQASSSLSSDHNKDDICSILANWIDKGQHFGDLSIQIHYGKGNIEKLKSGAAWHTGACCVSNMFIYPLTSFLVTFLHKNRC